jgi:hypothetical protein
MVKRYCPKCNAEFNRKSSYDNHMNKKYDCIIIKSNSNEEKTDQTLLCGIVQKSCRIMQNTNNESKNIKDNIKNILKPTNTFICCSFCNKNFSSKSTLTRHIKENCKIKKESDNEKENIFKLLLEKDKENKEKINQLEKQNKLLMDKIDKLINIKKNSKSSKTINNNNNLNNITNMTNSNNTTNTQNNQIIMINYGKEDLNLIDKQLFIDRVIKKNINGVQIPDEVLKMIHFNPLYPQMSNIYISDINRDKCMIYDSGVWKLSSIDNIPQIMNKVCIFSNKQIEILKAKYPNNKPLQDRLKIIGKYNGMIDNDYLEELKDNQEENKEEIKRCENFQKKTYHTFKTTLYNEGKNIKKLLVKN